VTDRHVHRLTILVFAAALLLLFHRLLLGEVFFWGLPALQFVPWRDYAWEVLRAGQLPLWNPYNGAGAPLLANYQSALLYPPSWLGLILPLAWSMSLTAVLHLALAGWGMTRLLARLGAPALGQGMAALAFGLTGYLVARLGTFPMIQAAAWLPWLLWAAHLWLTNGSRRAAGLLALFAALQLLAGHAQTAWYSLLLVGLFAAWLVIFGAARGRIARLVGAGLALTLGASIAALQLVPTAELLLSSQRAEGVSYDFAMNFSFGWARLLNFVSPVLFGTPADGSYLESGFYFEYAVYIGLIPFISAIAAIIAWLNRRRSSPVLATVPFWTLVTLVGLVFALGPTTPIFPFLYRDVPTFDLFQAPARWSLWTVFGLSVLAGLGVSVWGRSFNTRRWARRALAASISVLILSIIGIFALPQTGGAAVLLRAMTAAALLGVAACWLTLRQPEQTSPRYGRWVLLVLVIVAADLVWAGWGHNPTVPPAFYDRQTSTQPQIRADWPAEVEEQVKFDSFFRVENYRLATAIWPEVRASGLPNLNLLDRQPLLDSFDPLLPGAFAQFARRLEATPLDARDGLYLAAGVGAVINADGARQPTAAPAPAPRAWLVSGVCWHTDESSLYAALADIERVTTQVHILGDGPCPPAHTPATDSNLLLGDEGGRLTIDVRSPFDGWLVLADTDYPGWTASINGIPTPIYRANGAFRAVQVPPGEQTVTFTYTPAWLLPATITSAIALLLTLVLLFLKPTQADLTNSTTIGG
jgi:hypothetical protein